jgi:hypothetical protein
MSDQALAMVLLAIYKIVSLTVGTIFAYMGYRLFMSGVWGNAGDLNWSHRDSKVTLKQAAPGTFFAFFGTVIIGFTIYTGLSFETGSSVRENNIGTEQQGVILPAEPPF